MIEKYRQLIRRNKKNKKKNKKIIITEKKVIKIIERQVQNEFKKTI